MTMYLQEGALCRPITMEAIEILHAEIGCNLAQAAFDKFRQPPGEYFFREIEEVAAERVEAFITRIHGTKADAERAKTILNNALRLQYIGLMRAAGTPWKGSGELQELRNTCLQRALNFSAARRAEPGAGATSADNPPPVELG